jgi:hypothetical protein
MLLNLDISAQRALTSLPPDLSENHNDFILKLPLDGLEFCSVNLYSTATKH